METATEQLVALEQRHGPGVYRSRGICVVRGEGTRLYDETGRGYLDLTAGYGVASLGHAHPALADAVRTQAERVIACSNILSSDQRARYLADLAAVLPGDLDRVFLCNSGTEATEAAIKFARLSTGRPGVVAAMRGFHGRTMGALSATWDRHYREPFAPLVPGYAHVPYDNLAKLDAAIGDDTAAVVLEVVQGEGGVRPGSVEFLRGAQELCRARGALLVLDEVQTGFGRTGRLFALEHHDLEPDIVCLAKGMAGGFPMGAAAFGGRVAELPVGAHGSTFGGNPLACAAARATLATILAEDLPARAADNGAWLLQRIRELAHPAVRDVRGLGLMVGVELRGRSAPVLAGLQERGVIALNAGPNVVRFLPPLTVSRSELTEGVDALRQTLDAVAEGGSA